MSGRLYPDVNEVSTAPELARFAEIENMRNKINTYDEYVEKTFKKCLKHQKGLEATVIAEDSVAMVSGITGVVLIITVVGAIAGIIPAAVSGCGGIISVTMKIPEKYFTKKAIKYIKLSNLINKYIIDFNRLHSKIIDDNTITDSEYNKFLDLYKNYETEVRKVKYENIQIDSISKNELESVIKKAFEKK